MSATFKTKRDLALTAFGAAVALSFIVPVHRQSLLILISGVGVLSTFIVDKMHREKRDNGSTK